MCIDKLMLRQAQHDSNTVFRRGECQYPPLRPVKSQLKKSNFSSFLHFGYKNLPLGYIYLKNNINTITFGNKINISFITIKQLYSYE